MEGTLNWGKTVNYPIKLGRDGLQLIKDYEPGTVILCQRGVLWVTQSGDLEDYVLGPGTAFSSEHRGEVLIQAMKDAVLSIRPPQRASSVRFSVLHHN